MNVRVREGRVSSCYVVDPYFPAIATIGRDRDYVRFVGLYHGDDLVELQVDPETSRVAQVTVVGCHKFDVRHGCLDVPDATEGIVAVGPPGHQDCDDLFLDVYDDGIAIRLGGELVSEYARSGNVVFGVSMDGMLVEVLLSHMTPEEVTHARRCLLEDQEQGVWMPSGS